jgi:hypothetical protein
MYGCITHIRIRNERRVKHQLHNDVASKLKGDATVPTLKKGSFINMHGTNLEMHAINTTLVT